MCPHIPYKIILLSALYRPLVLRYVGEAIGRLSPLPLLFTITCRSFQLYLGWVIYLTFTQDVDWEVYRKFMGEKHWLRENIHHLILLIAENSLEVAHCATRYKLNYCATKVIPALVDDCTAWKLCMDTNPESVPRLEIMSRLFGQMVERFMENFSLRTLVQWYFGWLGCLC